MTEFKVRYTLREYADLVGENIVAVRSQVRRGTLKTERVGKMHVIYLSQIRAENPERWASIVELDRLRNRSLACARLRHPTPRMPHKGRGVGWSRRQRARTATSRLRKGEGDVYPTCIQRTALANLYGKTQRNPTTRAQG